MPSFTHPARAAGHLVDSCAARLELRLIEDLVDVVRNGLKTSSVRAGRPAGLRVGPALFRVPGSGVTIPIWIESVTIVPTVFALPAADVAAQGPFVRRILIRRGLDRARRAIHSGMRTYYPGHRAEHAVTVIHFRVTPEGGV